MAHHTAPATQRPPVVEHHTTPSGALTFRLQDGYRYTFSADGHQVGGPRPSLTALLAMAATCGCHLVARHRG